MVLIRAFKTDRTSTPLTPTCVSQFDWTNSIPIFITRAEFAMRQPFAVPSLKSEKGSIREIRGSSALLGDLFEEDA